jgi:transposase
MANRTQFQQDRRTRQNRYFSEAFKRRKVREIEQGLIRVSELSRTYEVSTSAIYKWLRKYSQSYAKQIRQIVEIKSDTRKIEALQAKIRELERLVGQKQIELEFKDKMIELAEQIYQVDIKKKLGSGPSSGTGNTEKKSR